MRTWIRNPLSIFVDPGTDAGAGLVIQDSRIVELVPHGDEPGDPVDEVFDASAHVILPGLVNTHHHYYQTLTRACPPALGKALFPWLKSLYPIWANLDDASIHVATRLAATELLLSGCTTSADHHYLFTTNSPRALDVQVEALRKAGLRSTLTRGSMSLGEDQGGLPPNSTVQDDDTILADSERVIDAYHDHRPGSFLQVALAPCSPFSVSTALMQSTADLARRKGVRLHTHLAETHDETRFCLSMFGRRPVDYLEEVGWLANDVWLAHGIHFDDGEVARLGAAGVGITHCPSSNMLLGSGQCRVLELEQAGCAVGLGVDGSASNDGSNLAEELRQAFLLQRLHYAADRVGHREVIRWATEGSAACLGRTDIGRIETGREADLAMFRLDEPRFSGAGDPLAALVLCGAKAADRVMVGGEWKVVDGTVVDLDLDELLLEHRAAAAALLRRTGYP